MADGVKRGGTDGPTRWTGRGDPFIGHTVLKKFPGFGEELWEGRVEKVVAPGKYRVFFERDSSELTMTSKALTALGLGKRSRAATSTSAAAHCGEEGKGGGGGDGGGESDE